MSHSEDRKLQALEEISLGALSKVEIAKKYGVTTKTLWQWGKIPLNTIKKQKAKKATKPELHAQMENRLASTEILTQFEIDTIPDSLYVDQLVDKADREFVMLYVRTRNKVKSASAAYGNCKSHKNAWGKAQNMLRRPHIIEAVRQLNLLQIKTFESDILPTCIDFLHNVITADLYDYTDEAGNLLPMEEVPEEMRSLLQAMKKKTTLYQSGESCDGKPLYSTAESHEIKLPDKLKAIEIMGKIAGMWHESNMSVNFTQNNINTTQQKAKEGMELLAQITSGK